MDDLDSRVEMSRIRLIKSVFELNGETAPASESVAIAVSLKNNGEFSDDGERANFIQRLQTLELDSSPFRLEVEFAAVFHLDPPPLPLAWPHYVRKVFPRLLFPHLRDYVADLTRRGGFSPLNLSPNLFDEGESRMLETSPDDNKWIH